MRLVSVVVPLWLIATTSVSDMSSRSWKPRELGGDDGVGAQRWSSASAVSTAARLCPAIGGGALTDDDDAADAAVAQPRPHRRRAACRRRAAPCRRPSRSTTLPRSVLRNDAGASEISLSRKCGKSPRSMSRVVISACCELVVVHRQRRAVERVPLDAVERARARPRRAPPPGRASPRRARDRPASRRPCAGRWTSPRPGRRARWRRRRRPRPCPRRAPGRCPGATGAAGRARRRSGRAMPIEPCELATRSCGTRPATVAPLSMPAGDERGDHLGVGGDLGRHLQALERLEVGVVVDVTVERAHHVGTLVAVELLVVERVRVRLGDDADARPARVAEHHDLGVVVRERELQQRRRRGSRRAAPRCCRRAHRSRPRPCRRTRARRRWRAPSRNRRAGRPRARRPAARSAGSSRSRP